MQKICPTCDAGDPTSVIPFEDCECKPTEINRCSDCQTADISGPGKFEGEPIETFHAHHMMLEGFADDTNGPYWRVGSTICHESSDGFVTGEHFDCESDARIRWTEGIEPLCFDESCGLDHDGDKHKPCQAPADGSPCDESAQDGKRYCTFHLGQIQKLADAGRLP